MSDLGFNKIAFCVLGTGLALIGFNEASHAMFHVPHHEKPGFFVEVKEEGAGGPAVAEGPIDFGVLLAAADVAKGQEQSNKCKQCHHLGQGEGTLTGPELFGVVGRPVASMQFKYATGKGSLTEVGGNWDYDKLYHFLEAPKKFAPGTAMNFAGINSRMTGKQDRINLLAYLRTLAPGGNMLPLPAPLPPQAAAAPGAPTEGATPAAPGAVPGATPAPAGATPVAPGTTPAPGTTAPATPPPAGAPAKPPAPAAPH